MEIDMILREIEKDTGPDLLGGFRPVGVNTARQTEILAQFARLKMGPFVEAMNTVFSWACHMALVIIDDVISEPVSFIGQVGKHFNRHTIDPSKLRGHWWPQVVCKSALPVDKAANWQLGQLLLPLIGPEKTLEDYADREDAQADIKAGRVAMIENQLLTALLANPEVHALASQHLTERLEPSPEEEEAMMRQLQGMPGASLPPGGIPKGVGAPPLLRGMPRGGI